MKNKLKLRGKTCFLILLFAAMFCQQVFSATVVYPSGGSDQELLAAKEVRRYLYLRTDQLLTVQSVTSVPGSGDLIVVADDDDPLVNAVTSDNAPMGGILIKSYNQGGRDILVIAGDDDIATLYAAYRFTEKLGCRFYLHGDTIPDAKIPLDITGYDEHGQPLTNNGRQFTTRGIQPFQNFPSGSVVWGTDDYKKHVTQLPKMGMNFIGMHTYMDPENCSGPHLNYWLGHEDDVNPDGTVNYGYKGTFFHTHQQIEGWAPMDTSVVPAGGAQLFETDGWPSEFLGETFPANQAEYIAAHNKTADLWREVFTLAQSVGVITATGPGGALSSDMPPEVASRLQSQYGLAPGSQAATEAAFKGLYKWLNTNNIPLDYFWLWTAEGFGCNPLPAWVTEFEQNAQWAQNAYAGTSPPPFGSFAVAGWTLGQPLVPNEFADVFPDESVPFSSMNAPQTVECGYDDDVGRFDQLPSGRVKWPFCWLEYDWGMSHPQMEVLGIIWDARDALNKECDGFIAEHWRTKALAPMWAAFRKVLWTYAPTGSAIDHTANLPGRAQGRAATNPVISDIYTDWATQEVGPVVGPQLATILANHDINGGDEFGYEQPPVFPLVETMGEHGAIGGCYDEGWDVWGPGYVFGESFAEDTPELWSWADTPRKGYEFNPVGPKTAFVDDIVALRPQVQGAGNLARFDYIMNQYKAYKAMCQWACEHAEYYTDYKKRRWEEAAVHRSNMARLWEEVMTYMVQKVHSAPDMGALLNIQWRTWVNYIEAVKDAGFGGTLPPDKDPTMNYLGDNFIVVTPVLTQVQPGEALNIKAIIMGTVTNPTLYYRTLGESSFTSIPLTHDARAVYRATIPAQSDDFEWYVEANTSLGDVVFPATAGAVPAEIMYQTVVVAAPGGPPPPDTDPPTPDPMTWASVPDATGENSIAMTATTASDPSGVEYYFMETSANPGGSDSGWQDSADYNDTGLNAGTQYCYEVQARDKSPNQNLTNWSTSQCATTDLPDTTPPSPDPMTWSSVPAAAGSSQINMTATTATDPSGVEYYFDETSGNPGGSDSGWQASESYSDNGLSASTQYCYEVTARDQSVNLNETAPSSNQCATTEATPDTTPPTPDPMTWASVPASGGTDNISMTATTATDPSGVEYFFDETSGNPGGTDSGWQDPANYTDTGLNDSTQYCYRVQARDKSPNQNATVWSTTECATTDTIPDTDPPTPNPATWASVPAAGGSDNISMTATTGSDPSGVEYEFDETTGGPGGTDSGWQASESYTDTGLSASTTYTYRVRMRDQSVNQNTGSWSTSESATTSGGGTWTKVDDTDPGFTYTGNFDDWQEPQAYMGTVTGLSKDGITSYTFTGTKVRFYGCLHDVNNSEGDVYIDDVFKQTINFYNDSFVGDVMLYESENLSSGQHTFRIERTGGEALVDALEYFN